MVSVVVFEFGVMRCQPLRRALGAFMMMLDQSLRTNSCND
ncbi:acetyltransferase [Vibrio cholerae]|nr:acetyltransferase [Vibrio cholerae]